MTLCLQIHLWLSAAENYMNYVGLSGHGKNSERKRYLPVRTIGAGVVAKTADFIEAAMPAELGVNRDTTKRMDRQTSKNFMSWGTNINNTNNMRNDINMRNLAVNKDFYTPGIWFKSYGRKPWSATNRNLCRSRKWHYAWLYYGKRKI